MPHASSSTVHTYEASASGGVFRSQEPEPLWRTWARPLSVIAIVVVLVGLGIANVVMRARWHQVEDGVLWSARAEGVTAVAIAADSPAAASGVQPGDILLAVNGVPVESPADVVEFQHRGTAGMRLAYTLLRSRFRIVEPKNRRVAVLGQNCTEIRATRSTDSHRI